MAVAQYASVRGFKVETKLMLCPMTHENAMILIKSESVGAVSISKGCQN